MNGLSHGQIIEFFHLAFLQVLQVRLDQASYVVKGGANLRYFFDSPRYSEDLDLDALLIEAWKLEEKTDAVFASPAFGSLLRTGGLAIGESSKPKQMDTTQRWKILIGVNGQVPVRTKIEFSHRSSDQRRILEAVPERIVAPYALRAPTMLHYSPEAAIEQKVEALALRAETQARDVFDLELLLRRHSDAVRPGDMDAGLLDIAVHRAGELPFEAFSDQVLPFLNSDILELYNDREAWHRMQTFVSDQLSRLR
jgi:predicted nucleotidyltransferase component of viral defense system